MAWRSRVRNHEKALERSIMYRCHRVDILSPTLKCIYQMVVTLHFGVDRDIRTRVSGREVKDSLTFDKV